MEFLTAKQKKQKARRLYLGYLLLSVLISLATYVLISTALGFEILNSKGQVVQNGLLFIDSTPDNAEVYINGRRESNNTNAKFSVPESNYDVRLKKAGYRDWEGSLSLVGGTVEFLTYPRLMPVLPVVLNSQAIAAKPNALQSRDKRWVASYSPELPRAISLRDLDKPEQASVTIPVPGTIVGDKAIESLEIVEWAGDNEHFLISIRAVDNPVPSYVIMRRDKPEEFTNISATYTLSAGDTIGFWDAKRDRIYIKQSGGGVLIGNLKDKSLSEQSLVVDPVLEFFPISKERAIYTTKSGDDILVKYYNDSKTYVINTLKFADKPVIAKSFGFNSSDYILLAGEGFEKTLLYKNFEDAVKESSTGRVAPFFTMPSSSPVADVSRSNRFVMGSNGKDAQVYDIEGRELFRYELPVARPADIGWFDDARLFAIGSDQRLSVFDFTGKNVYELATTAQSRPFVNQDVTVASYIIKDADGLKNIVVDLESPTL